MTRWTRFSLLIVLSVAWCAAAAPPLRAGSDIAPIETIDDLPGDARVVLYNAQREAGKGQADKAVHILESYLHSHANDDDHFLLHIQLAEMLAQAGRAKDALTEYERAVAIEPRYAPGWVSLGETAYGLGDYGRAAAALRRGYDGMAEKRPEVLYYAAAAQILDQHAADALPVLEDLTSGAEGEPRLEWYRGLVMACIQTRDQERGQRAVASLTSRFGESADAWQLVFQYAAAMSDYKQAAAALTTLGFIRPLDRREQVQLGDLYAALDAPAAAADCYAAATADSASGKALERLASAYFTSYQYDAAEAAIRRGLEQAPTFRLWSLLGDVHFTQEHYAEAYRAFSECVKIKPGEGRPYIMLGYCAMELGKYDDALANLETARQYPQYAERAQKLIDHTRELAHRTP